MIENTPIEELLTQIGVLQISTNNNVVINGTPQSFLSIVSEYNYSEDDGFVIPYIDITETANPRREGETNG